MDIRDFINYLIYFVILTGLIVAGIRLYRDYTLAALENNPPTRKED